MQDLTCRSSRSDQSREDDRETIWKNDSDERETSRVPRNERDLQG
jgi:hypothetical protein